MAGLQWPISPGHKTTQGFAGNNPFEPAGFLRTDGGGPRVARKAVFPNSVAHAHLHGAIDISCVVGTPVVAPEAGTIVGRGTYTSTGEQYMMLQIRPGTVLFFTHLSTFLVAKGAHVTRGQKIALSGNTGKSTGPHLHWEVRINSDVAANPLRSSSWYKFNPERLRVGGDLADMPAIQPPGAIASAPATAPAATAEAATTAPAVAPDPGATGATSPSGGSGAGEPAVGSGPSDATEPVSLAAAASATSEADIPRKLVGRGKMEEF